MVGDGAKAVHKEPTNAGVVFVSAAENDDVVSVTSSTDGWTMTFDKRDGSLSYSVTAVRTFTHSCARFVQLTLNADGREVSSAAARAVPQSVASAHRQ
jgi:hypothetical protein